MAVREFTDNWGTEWRVWDVTPEVMYPITRSEEFMADLQDGWLVFESSEGEKRRLTPYPPDWRTMSAFEIERWCMRATKVPPGPARRAED